MKRIAALAVMLSALLVVLVIGRGGGFPMPTPAEATETTQVFLYDDTGNGIGPIAPNGGASHNVLSLPIPPFCTNCYITRIEPDLVYWNDPNPSLTNGMIANYNGADAQGVWLHHDTVIDGCPIPAPRAIFLSGNERTVYQAPPGYGTYIDPADSCNNQWFLGWHIHNNGTAAHKVRVKFTVTYRMGETLNKLKGLGLNVSTQQEAEYQIATGYSDTHTCPSNCGTNIATDHVVTAAEQGQVIAGGGHVHDYGIAVSAYNMTRGKWICTAIGGYGTGSRYWQTTPPPNVDPGHPASANAQALIPGYHQPGSPPPADHIQNMSLCSISPLGSIVCTGDVIRTYASYNNTSGFPIPDAMGILSLALPATTPDADGDGTWDGCDSGDSDNDVGHFSDQVEFMAGTMRNAACGVNAWPPDLNNDTFVDIVGDISQVASNFGQAVPPAPARQDIAPNPTDGVIDVTGDISRMAGLFGQHC